MISPADDQSQGIGGVHLRVETALSTRPFTNAPTLAPADTERSLPAPVGAARKRCEKDAA